MSDVHDVDEELREPRTATFPVVAMPTQAADVAGYVLVASAVLNVAAGVVQAVSYRVAQSTGPLGFPTEVTQPRLATVDRVELLTRSAGAVTALLVLLGAVCLIIGARSDDGRGHWRITGLWAAAAVAAIVLAANGTLCLALVFKTDGVFVVQAVADRLASALALLAPIAMSGGVLFYVLVHVTSEPEPVAGHDGTG